jgi:excisionase family DNA binding protein
MQRVLTTGQVARVFSVNINTVIKWFDEGKLEGFRLPRSNERRIYRDSVLTFMREHGIANELLREFDDEEDVRKKSRRNARPLTMGAVTTNPPRGAELRAFPRKPVEIVGTITAPDGGGEIGQVVVRNLSLGGAYITGFPVSGGIPAEFRLSVAANGHPALDTACQLVHARREGDEMTLGCRFTRVDPLALQTYLVNV